MTHYKGKKLSDIDRAQQAELERQKAVDDKHDSQFLILALVEMFLVIWLASLTFAIILK